LLKRFSFALERRAYRQSAAVVTCSSGMSRRIEAKMENWLRKPPIEMITNSCDLDEFEPCAKRRALIREQYGITPNQVVVLYTGAMGISNAMGELVAAIEETSDNPHIVWWLAGAGREAGKLKRLAGDRIRFWGRLPRNEVVDLFRGADLNVITFLRAPLFEENSPNKFFDGIAAGLPALFNRSTWLAPWLVEYKCGQVCDHREGESLGAGIKRLAGDPEARARMGRGALRLAREIFSRDVLAQRYLDLLAQCVKAPASLQEVSKR
jgi:glycosyltransferase involved in cell wall biosynthesis